ncbi:MAG: sulfatase [Prolixibacteraceae bacterium]|jgi:arylsulfatase A-like enzyme|nr:sulfatase [Prolixibacteraceae bacterium]
MKKSICDYRSKLMWAFLGSIGLHSCSVDQSSSIDKVEHPNILWITCEDISPNLGCYGDSAANTPVIDQLASEGVRFTNVFTTVGVCAPSRSSIITGVYPVSLGTHNMRTGKDIMGISNGVYKHNTGIVDPMGNSVPQYSAVIPSKVKCFTEYLRNAGYYCTNNAKTDYQFAAPITAWDENDTHAHWRNRPKGKPFFSVFNLNVCHESQIWKKKNDSLLVDANKIALPPYFPEDSVVRQDVARKYSNITEMDQQVGAILKQLKEDGLLEKTIIFFFSDHGGPLPRGKRAIYDSGLKVPMVVRFPNQKKHGIVNSELISFVDLAPTMLSLAHISAPKYMQGQAFMGAYKANEPRREIYGSKDRMDEYYDMVRCVRDTNFLYVKNFHPSWSYYKDIAYRKQLDMMRRLLQMHHNGELNKEQELFFRTHKPVCELYDVHQDPYQLNNLADQPKYREVIKRMDKKITYWQKRVNDKGLIAEGQMVREMWPNMEQPTTMTPEVTDVNGLYHIHCNTEGASIAWQVSIDGKSKSDWKYWNLYNKPLRLKKGDYLHTVAIRIGYKQSQEQKLRIP